MSSLGIAQHHVAREGRIALHKSLFSYYATGHGEG